MSIATFQKISIAGALEDKEPLLHRLQQFGRLHIIPAEASGGFERNLSPKDKRTYEALHLLQQAPDPRRPLKRWMGEDLTLTVAERVSRVVEETLTNRDQIVKTEDQIGALLDRIKLLQPWGDFHLPPEECTDYFSFWFYQLPLHKRPALHEIDLPWQIIGQNNKCYFVVLISKQEPAADLLPVERVHLGSQPLSVLYAELEQAETLLEELQIERQSLSRYRYLLAEALTVADNQALFQYAASQTHRHGEIFTLQAWLPEADFAALQTLAQELGFAVLAEAPKRHEQPPTLLQPAKMFAPGAMLATIYQLPAYRSWDPSAHLYLSFALFFSMILSDAGYSLILLGGLLMFWQKLGRNPAGQQLRSLLRVMFSAATLWGVMAGSYFGFDVEQFSHADSWLVQASIIDLNNYPAMMTLSIYAGVIHILIASLSLAWSRRQNIYALGSQFGWVGMVIGGVLLWQNQDVPAVMQWAYTLLALSALSIIGFTGLAQAPDPENSVEKQTESSTDEHTINKNANAATVLKRGLQGVIALTSISKLFGDILSYMRLFALGLASASLGLTFNNLAQAALESAPGIGIVFALLIFLFGHTVNLGLAIMSGVVHGLRLNFIEFYNWGDPGEGYPYEPFALTSYGANQSDNLGDQR